MHPWYLPRNILYILCQLNLVTILSLHQMAFPGVFKCVSYSTNLKIFKKFRCFVLSDNGCFLWCNCIFIFISYFHSVKNEIFLPTRRYRQSTREHSLFVYYAHYCITQLYSACYFTSYYTRCVSIPR
jgi:hypothetical protein